MVRTFSRKQMQAKINTICIYYDLYLHKSRPKSPCPVSEPTHLEVAARIRDKPYQRLIVYHSSIHIAVLVIKLTFY